MRGRHKGRFRKLTAQQRETLATIKKLGSMVVQPQDARQLKALWRRGWVRYRRDREHGDRVAYYVGPVHGRRGRAQSRSIIEKLWRLVKGEK